jgi:hypothetical protein
MPDIRTVILCHLKAWREDQALPHPQYRWPGVSDMVSAQGQIGWRAFLEGAVLKDWAAKQQQCYLWLQKKHRATMDNRPNKIVMGNILGHVGASEQIIEEP